MKRKNLVFIVANSRFLHYMSLSSVVTKRGEKALAKIGRKNDSLVIILGCAPGKDEPCAISIQDYVYENAGGRIHQKDIFRFDAAASFEENWEICKEELERQGITAYWHNVEVVGSFPCKVMILTHYFQEDLTRVMRVALGHSGLRRLSKRYFSK